MNRWFLILVPVIVVSIIRLKPIDLFLRSLNTLIHEFSHAFVALCLGEKVKEIKLNDDFSGSCTTKSKSKFKAFLVSLSGYTMCAIVSYLLIRFMNNEYNKYVFYLLIFLCIFSLIMYIRNTFGILWVVGFLAINLIIVFVPYFSKIFPQIIYVYANIIMIENFLSTLTLLHLNILSSKKAGDSYNLQKATHLPALFYTLFFVAISCFFIYKSFIIIFNQ
jgi:hypothetical protein